MKSEHKEGHSTGKKENTNTDHFYMYSQDTVETAHMNITCGINKQKEICIVNNTGNGNIIIRAHSLQ